MPIFEFACQAGHEFQLWDDAARLCPVCGSEFLKRVFITPPMVNTPKTKALDNLVRTELERQGITNIQGGGHEGETEKVTYKTPPETLAAQKIERDFPALAQKQTIPQIDQRIKQQWSNLGVKGIIKSGIGSTPEHAPVKQALTSVGKYDSRLVNRVKRVHPEDAKRKVS